MSELDLDAIEQRAEAATAGPWLTDSHSHLAKGCMCMCCDDPPTVWQTTNGLFCDDVPASTNDFGKASERCEDAFGYTYADAEFIAHARTDVPALVARIRELEAQRDAAYNVMMDAATDLQPALWEGDERKRLDAIQDARHRLRREAHALGVKP